MHLSYQNYIFFFSGVGYYLRSKMVKFFISVLDRDVKDLDHTMLKYLISFELKILKTVKVSYLVA